MAVAEYRTHDAPASESYFQESFPTQILPSRHDSPINSFNLATSVSPQTNVQYKPMEIPKPTIYPSQESNVHYQDNPPSTMEVKNSKLLDKFNSKLYWHNSTFNYKGKPISNTDVTRLLRDFTNKTYLYSKPLFVFYKPIYHVKSMNHILNSQRSSNRILTTVRNII
jgi:hypothetical protein